jgi:xylono-1,5-lactonase
MFRARCEASVFDWAWKRLRRQGIDILWDGRTEHGESPIWVARLGCLIVLDTSLAGLALIDPTKRSVQQWRLPEPCYWLVEHARPRRFLAGLRNRIVEIEFQPEAGPTIAGDFFHLPEHGRGIRFNDAKADNFGCVYAGTMDERGERPVGSLYRIDPYGAARIVDQPYTIFNGPAFDPSGEVCYLADSAKRLIFAFDLDTTGTLLNRRVHIRFDPRDGYPDGMSCDRDGGLWVAHWGAGRVSRFGRDGRLDRVIHIPVSGTSSVAFFGSSLNRLAVTTAARDYPRQRRAGAVFAVEPGVCGFASAVFGEPRTGKSTLPIQCDQMVGEPRENLPTDPGSV